MSYIKELQSRLQSLSGSKGQFRNRRNAAKNITTNVNTPLFTVGDKVLLNDEKIRRGRSATLSPLFVGPYEIIDVDGVNITLKLPKNMTKGSC